MLIRAGSTVLAPRAATVLADVTSRIADTGQLSLAPEAGVRRTTVKAGKQDTVASIAARYRVKAADVARWNAVEASAQFKPGQAVTLELPVRAAKAGGATKTAAKPRANKSGTKVAAAKTAR
jgi:membrane-bound lytic murein transglycosylase D